MEDDDEQVPSTTSLSTTVSLRGCDQVETSPGNPTSVEQKDGDCGRNSSGLQDRHPTSHNVYSGSSSSSVHGACGLAQEQQSSGHLETLTETKCSDCSTSITASAGAKSSSPASQVLVLTDDNITLQNVQPATEGTGPHLNEDEKPCVRCAEGRGEHTFCVKFGDIAGDVRKDAGSLASDVVAYPVFERQNRRLESGYYGNNGDIRDNIKEINRRVSAVISDSEETVSQRGEQVAKRRSRPRQRGYREPSPKQKRRYTSSHQVDLDRLNEAVESLTQVFQAPERVSANRKSRTDRPYSSPPPCRVISPSLDDLTKVETVCNILESVTESMKDTVGFNLEPLVIDARNWNRNYAGGATPQQALGKRRATKPVEKVARKSALRRHSTNRRWGSSDFGRNSENDGNEEWDDDELVGYERPDKNRAYRVHEPAATVAVRRPGGILVSARRPTSSSPQRRGKSTADKKHRLIWSSKGSANPDLYEVESVQYAGTDDLEYEDSPGRAVMKDFDVPDADVGAEDEPESEDEEYNEEKASRARSEGGDVQKGTRPSPVGRTREESRKPPRRKDGVSVVVSTSTVINSDSFGAGGFHGDHRGQTRKDAGARAGTDIGDLRDDDGYPRKERQQDQRPDERSTGRGGVHPNDRRRTEGVRVRRDASEDSREVDNDVPGRARGVGRREVGGKKPEGGFKRERRATECGRYATSDSGEGQPPFAYKRDITGDPESMDTPPEYRRAVMDGFRSRGPSFEDRYTQSSHEYGRNLKGDNKKRLGKQFCVEFTKDIEGPSEERRPPYKRSLSGYRRDAKSESFDKKPSFDYEDTNPPQAYLRDVGNDSMKRQSPLRYRRGSERDLRRTELSPTSVRYAEGEFRRRERPSDYRSRESSRESFRSVRDDSKGGRLQRDIEGPFRSRESSFDSRNGKGNDTRSREPSHECRALEGGFRRATSTAGYTRDSDGKYTEQRPPSECRRGPSFEYQRQRYFRKTELPRDHGRSIEDSFKGRELTPPYRSDFALGLTEGAPRGQRSERGFSGGSHERQRCLKEDSRGRVASSEEEWISADNRIGMLTSSSNHSGVSGGLHSRPPSFVRQTEATGPFRKQSLRNGCATARNVTVRLESSLDRGVGDRYALGEREHSREEPTDVYSAKTSGPYREQRVEQQWMGKTPRSPRGGTLRRSRTECEDVAGPVRKELTVPPAGSQSRHTPSSGIRSLIGSDSTREMAVRLGFCPAPPRRVSSTSMPCSVQEVTVSNDNFGLPILPQERSLDAGYVPSPKSSRLYPEAPVVRKVPSSVAIRQQLSHDVDDTDEERELNARLQAGRCAQSRFRGVLEHTDEIPVQREKNVESSRSRGIALRVYSDENAPATVVTGKPCLRSEKKPGLFRGSTHGVPEDGRTAARRKSKSRSRSSRKSQPEFEEHTASTALSVYDDCKSKFEDEPMLQAHSSPVSRINVWHIPMEDFARHLAHVVPPPSSSSQSGSIAPVCVRSMSKHSRSGHTCSKREGTTTQESPRRWPQSADLSAQRRTSLELLLQRPPSRQRLCRRHRALNLEEGQSRQPSSRRVRRGTFSVELLTPSEIKESEPPHFCARLKQTQPGLFSLTPVKTVGASQVTATTPAIEYPDETQRLPAEQSFVVQSRATSPAQSQAVGQAALVLRHPAGQVPQPGAQTFVLPGEHGRTVVTVLTKTVSATALPTGQACTSSAAPGQQPTLSIRGTSHEIVTELVPLQPGSIPPASVQQAILIQSLPQCEPLEQRSTPPEQEPGREQQVAAVINEFECTVVPSESNATSSLSQSLHSTSESKEVGDTTGSAWQTDVVDEWGMAGSTALMLPKEERYGTKLPLAFRRLSDRGQSALLIALAVVVLAGFSGALSLYFKRDYAPEEDEDTFERGEGASMLGPRQGVDEAGSVARNITRSCVSLHCSVEALALTRALDRSVNPCEDFYGFVCSSHSKSRGTSGSADAAVVEDIERAVVAYFKESGFAGPDVAASRQFWRDCTDVEVVAQLGNDPFEGILNMTGLRGWPYAAYNHHSDALEPWKVAGKILRHLSLSPLLSLRITPSLRRQNRAVVLGRGQDIPVEQRDLRKHIVKDSLTADVLKAILVIRRTGFKHDEVAMEVVDFAYKLCNLSEAEEKSLEKLSPATKLFVSSALSEDDFLHLSTIAMTALVSKFVQDLVRLVNSTSARIVLNYLGFSVVRHTFLFTPSSAKEVLSYGKKSFVAATRERECVRSLLNNALPKNIAEHVSFVAVKNNVDLPALRVLVGDVKRSLVARVSRLNWLDATGRARVTRHLREIDVRFFFEDNSTSTSSTQTDSSEGLPDVIASQALLSYQRLRAHRFRSSLVTPIAGFNNWNESFSHPDCTYNAERHVLLLPLATLYVKDPPTPLSLLFQVPRFGTKVLRCLLRVLIGGIAADEDGTLSPRSNRWTSSVRRHYEAIRTCLHEQYLPMKDPIENKVVDRPALLAAVNVIDNAVISPDRDVYEAYGRALRHTGGAQDNETLEGMTWDQLFYVSYGRGMCDALDNEQNFRRAARLHESPDWERVNVPLGNDDDFMRAFKCNGNSAMNRESRCRIWT